MSLSVADAAIRLGRSPQQVRKMIKSRALAAQRIGSTWVVDERSVARAADCPRFRGRPFAPVRAWAALDLLSGGTAPWLSASARAQVRAVIRAPRLSDADRWLPLLSAACDRHPMYCHPAVLDPLLGDDRVLEVGPRAASRHAIDLLSQQDRRELMVGADEWPLLARRYGLQDARPLDESSVVIWVPRWPVAMSLLLTDEHVARLAVAMSLLGSADPRARQAGQATLARARQLLLADPA